MRIHPVSVIAAFALGLCVSASAQSLADNTYVVHRSNGSVCPAGESSDACLNNAFGAIDDLERRVAWLEAGHRGTDTPVATVTHRESNQTSSESWWPKGHACLVGSYWDGTACEPRN